MPGIPKHHKHTYGVVYKKHTTDIEGTCNYDDEWDRPNTESHYEFKCLTKNGNDVACPLDIRVGGSAWLVYAIYSTGDSFGSDYGGCIEFINLFSTRKKARECAREIESQRSAEDWEVSYHDEIGKEVVVYAGWHGYFENFDSVEYIKLGIEEEE